MKFTVSQTPNDQFEFVLSDNEGDLILRSVNYADRDACIAAIRATITQLSQSNAYNTFTDDGQNYYVLNDANGNPIGVSEPFDSLDDVQSAIDAIIDDISDETEFQVDVRTTSTTTITETDILPSLSAIDFDSLYDFSLVSSSGKSGFEHLIRDSDKFHFFNYNDAQGNAILYSRSFDSASKRDKRIRQVIKAADKDARYEIREANGSFFFVLKEKNNLEIARSKSFATRAEAEAGIAYCKANIPQAAAEYPEPAKRKAVNEYNFDIKAESNDEGFHSVRGDDKAYYFLMNDAQGKPLLYSQGYSGGAARDNGMRTVIKNAGDSSRYEIKEKDGKYYFILRSSNRQEIGRSASFASKADAEKAIAWLVSVAPTYAIKYGIDTTTVERTKTVTQTESFTIEVEKPVPVAPPARESDRVQDNYLDCSAYAGHTDSPEKGFTIFKDADNQHYFSVVNNKGDVLFRSEGYPTTGARDNGIQSVIRNRDIKERYKVIEEDGKFYVILKAGNNQEIARSCPQDSEAAIWKLFPILAPESAKELDNYLDCEAYAGHTDSPEKGFRIFKGPDNQHYFSVVNDNGDVLFRSEGYPTTGARDNGIQSVIRNRDIKERYKTIEEDGKFYTILKAGNGQEIARSCPQDSEAALWKLFPILAPISALSSAGAEIPDASTEIKAETEDKGIDLGAATAAGAAALAGAAAMGTTDSDKADVKEVYYYDDADTGGGFKFRWWWLLPLLLIPFLWCMFNDCGCSKPKPAVVTDTTTITAPAVEDTTLKMPPPPPATTGCNCDANLHPLFNVSGTAKSLHRLGSNPEYGWSHGLTTTQFFDKLKKRYNTNRIDKEHLDGIAKAMGYANGFSDMSADLFTEVKLPKGTVGNLGYSKQHKFGVYALDMDKERDLEAFHIKSKNGCDVHIMKTCGNMMFFCDK